jgi:hypothetical protein
MIEPEASLQIGVHDQREFRFTLEPIGRDGYIRHRSAGEYESADVILLHRVFG